MDSGKVLVLYYHRINSLDRDTNLLTVSPHQFRQHMKYLKKNYYISRFEEDWTMLDGRRGVVITFDDGYLDNYQNALPVLEELEIPATIFVSTGNMDQKRELWWDELEYLLMEGKNIPAMFHLEDKTYEYIWMTDTYEMRLNCYRSLHFLMKNCIDVKKRNEWFDQLWDWRKQRPIARDTHLTLSDSACIAMAKSEFITIGGHTISHPSLAKLEVEDQKNEIEQSIEYLSKLLSKKIDVFSFPFGKKDVDYNQDTIDICRNIGIKKVASTQRGLWNKKIGYYAVPRNCIRNYDLFEFENLIERLWKE